MTMMSIITIIIFTVIILSPHFSKWTLVSWFY